MSKKATEFQKKEMSKMYRGKEILSGPEYLDFGVLNRLILKVMSQKQYRTAHEKRMPAWSLRFMGQTGKPDAALTT